MKNLLSIWVFALWANYSFGQATSACNCNATISQSGYYSAASLGIQPGQTLCIQAGTYSYLTFANIQGTSAQPITIKNCGGVVTLNNSSSPSGISFTNSQYFKLSGTGDAQSTYGIKVQSTSSGSPAVNVTGISSDFEVEYVEIAGAEYAGIMFKTDPSCDPATWRQNFTMRNVKVHHNYIHDINGKGIIFGYSAASITRSCSGQNTVVYGHDIVGLKLYQNTIENTGGEGILYANASNPDIYNNVIKNSGIKATAAGIQIGINAGGRIFNNQIIGTSGNGLNGLGYLGGNQIYNNVIVKSRLIGIYIDDRTETLDNSTVLLANNTIVETGGNGIRLDNEKSANTVINNAIVKPGSNVPISMLANVQVTDQNNYKGSAVASALFVDPANYNYRLPATSVLIDAGQSVSSLGIQTDIEGNSRSVNNTPDIGAYENQQSAPPTPTPTPPADCKVIISQNGNYNAAQLGVNPGEKICIRAGTYNRIAIANILGTGAQPIIVTNVGGLVTFDGTSNPTGLALNNCKYFKLTGSGDAQYQYGIKVQQTGAGVSGVSIATLSDHVEVERIEVAGADFAGIMIKTDPTCDPATWRQNFTMQDVKVHHNYIHDVKGEGLYIGNTFFSQGIPKNCDGQTITVYPHDIVGLQIYNNLTQRTGAEGIQYACASDAEVHDNTVLDTGLSPFALYQSNGIQIGGGAGGRLYNNVIKNSQADGIIMVGHLGNNKIFNNLVIDSKDYGIFCDDRTGSIPNTPVLIANNTIIRAGSDGIALFNEINYTTVVNNVIMFPGSGFFIYVNDGVPYADQNNYKSSDYNNTTFVDIGGDYHVHPQSPLRDGGRDVSAYGITFDLDNNRRPVNNKYDIGAYEYGSSASGRLAAEVYSEAPLIALTAYPSPCVDKLTLQLNREDQIKEVSVLTINGEAVMQVKPDKPVTSVELSVGSLATGLYVTRVITLNGEKVTGKFVKQ